MRLAHRHVILTGGSGGIGRFVVQGLVQEGARVSVIDLHDAGKVSGETDHADKVHFERCDLSKGDEITDAVARATSVFGEADVLVHAAAHQPANPFDEMSFSGWRTTFAVNVDAFVHLAKAVLPGMKKRGWGRILSFTSTTFNEGTAEHLDYVASKAALIGASRVLAKEVGKYGVTVNTLSPGLTKTTMSASHVDEMVKLGHPNYFDLYIQQQSLKRSLVPKDLVGPVIFLISEESGAISGQTLIVDGGKEHA